MNARSGPAVAGEVMDLRGWIAEMAAGVGIDVAALARPQSEEEVKREADEQERERQAAVRAAWAARRQAELELAGVDHKHARMLVAGTVRQTVALEAADRWADGDRLLLVLSGDKGRGKTLAAARMVHRFGGLLLEASLLCDEGWWLTQGRRSSITRATRDDLALAPLLVIDDLGQEAESRRAHTAEAVSTLIQHRTRKGLRTVITTNLLAEPVARARASAAASRPGPDARAAADAIMSSRWRAYLGGRAELIAARLLEHGTWIDCDGEDLRESERRGGR